MGKGKINKGKGKVTQRIRRGQISRKALMKATSKDGCLTKTGILKRMTISIEK
jgi:hypothetical protein